MKKKHNKKYYVGNIKEFSHFNGWFMGQFMDKDKYPLLKNKDVEIAWKKIPQNYSEPNHIHKKGLEINIVISGRLNLHINNKKFVVKAGQFFIIYPEAILSADKVGKHTEVIVVKCPSVKGDKFKVK